MHYLFLLFEFHFSAHFTSLFKQTMHLFIYCSPFFFPLPFQNSHFGALFFLLGIRTSLITYPISLSLLCHSLEWCCSLLAPSPDMIFPLGSSWKADWLTSRIWDKSTRICQRISRGDTNNNEHVSIQIFSKRWLGSLNSISIICRVNHQSVQCVLVSFRFNECWFYKELENYEEYMELKYLSSYILEIECNYHKNDYGS